MPVFSVQDVLKHPPFTKLDLIARFAPPSVVDVNAVKRAEQDLAVAKERLAADLETMNRPHEIGSRCLRGDGIGGILEHVLDAAILIGQADMGYIQNLDLAAGDLPGVVERGCPDPCLGLWEHLRCDQGLLEKTLRRGERAEIEDIVTSWALGDTPTQMALTEAGCRGVCGRHGLHRIGLQGIAVSRVAPSPMIGTQSRYDRRRQLPSDITDDPARAYRGGGGALADGSRPDDG